MSIQKNTPNFLRKSRLPFTTLINQTLDLIIDPASLGIYCYLASKCDSWEINNVHLQKRFNKGREFITARMADLKKIGLIKTYAVKDESGRIKYWETVLLNHISNQNTENPYCGENQYENDTDCLSVQNTGFPASGKTGTINKRYIEEIKDNIYPSISPLSENDSKIVDEDLGQENPVNQVLENEPNSAGDIPKSGYQKNRTLCKKDEQNDQNQCVDSGKLAQISTENSSIAKKRTTKATSTYHNDELFLKFYNAYPRQEMPTRAHKAFLKLKPNPELVTMLLHDIAQRMANNWKGRDPQFIPLPSRYLNDREFEGKIIPSVNRSSANSQYDHNDTSWIHGLKEDLF